MGGLEPAVEFSLVSCTFPAEGIHGDLVYIYSWVCNSSMEMDGLLMD